MIDDQPFPAAMVTIRPASAILEATTLEASSVQPLKKAIQFP